MIIYVPDFYPRFRCIADRCRHTCCVGWEIDIDPGTLAQYRKTGGPTGQKLRRSIALSPEPHFLLTDGERCPFLTDRNLCELIMQGLPLCQICADHPRFRNYWSDREEMGLGLACEEAARIILASPSPLRLIPLGEDEEEEETPSEEELALRRYRDSLIASVRETGPLARLREYLLYRHLAVDSPYNTYKNPGLPPGPIRCPSPETIDMVLNAPKTDYLFMCASPELNNTHIFSASYSGHAAAAQQYRHTMDTIHWEER